MSIVVKPFKSVNRKFNTGDVVTAADIDPGSVYTLADWIARGFVKDDDAPQPVAASSSSFSKTFSSSEVE